MGTALCWLQPKLSGGAASNLTCGADNDNHCIEAPPWIPVGKTISKDHPSFDLWELCWAIGTERCHGMYPAMQLSKQPEPKHREEAVGGKWTSSKPRGK